MWGAWPNKRIQVSSTSPHHVSTSFYQTDVLTFTRQSFISWVVSSFSLIQGSALVHIHFQVLITFYLKNKNKKPPTSRIGGSEGIKPHKKICQIIWPPLEHVSLCSCQHGVSLVFINFFNVIEVYFMVIIYNFAIINEIELLYVHIPFYFFSDFWVSCINF